MTIPLDIHFVGDHEILISWDDNHRSLYPCSYLRLNCPCAGCQDEWTGKRLITLDKISPNIKPLQMVPVGRYGVRFQWNDTHQTGIYSFEHLRRLCPCETCKKSRGEA